MMNGNRGYIVLLIGILIAVSCNDAGKSEETYSVEENSAVYGLNSLHELDHGLSSIQLDDYCVDVTGLDSITVSSGLEKVRIDGDVLTLKQSEVAMALEYIMLWKAGYESIVPVKKSFKENVQFSYDPQGQSNSSVQVKGEFNSWNVNATPLEKNEEGVYQTSMILSPGKYQYKMVLDGREASHRANPDSVSNGLGGFNSVLTVGQASGKQPFITASTDAGQLVITKPSPDLEIMALWNNSLVHLDEKLNSAILTLPKNAKEIKRSFVRVWGYNGRAISNEILVPLEFGSPVSEADELSRHDMHAMSLYNVFMDRFHNGDSSNNVKEDSTRVLPKANAHGGDLRGLIQKVEEGFFEDLGVNTIWISPIVKNVNGPYGYWPEPESEFSAYHGYWPISFTLVEPRFGTSEDVHELIEKAHERDLNVLLDFVANHVHEEHPYYKAHPEVATDLYLPDGTMNTKLWDSHRLTTWFDDFMPSLQLDKPEVYDMLTDSAVYWIKEYDFDGFRHDATKHVPEIFWRTLTKKLKTEVMSKGKSIYQIGETYGTRELVGAYVNSGQLDAQFDFNIYDRCVAALADNEGSFKDLSDGISASMNAFGHHHLMGNITGNQDRARFISYAGGALRLDEDAKVAGWTRDVAVGDSIAYKKSGILMALINTMPGLPVIYYGDEWGSYGGNDPDNRKMMRFDGLDADQSALRELTQGMLSLRQESLPLIYGDFREHEVSDHTYIFSRTYLGQAVFVLINDTDKIKKMTVKPEEDQTRIKAETWSGVSLQGDSDKGFVIQVDPHSFQIIH